MQMQFRANREVGYVTAGETYRVEENTKRAIYVRNVRTGGGTSFPHWEFNAAFKSGAFEQVVG